MPPDPYPPLDAWRDLTQAQKRALKLRHRGLSYVFWWWGGLWSLAFALLAAYGDRAWVYVAWAALGFLGIVGTRFFYHYYRWRVRPQGGEIYPGIYWTIMTAFMAAILLILRPSSLYALGAALFVMIMWMYMVQGLLTHHPFLPYLSAGTSLATLGGYLLFSPAKFAWWMTSVTGLSLLIGGWYRYRRQP